MTPKETATLIAFFKLLGRKAKILESKKKYNLVTATEYDYQGRYTISGTVFKENPAFIKVAIYDFKNDAKRDYILGVSRITPELAAKFTREAIAAYEKELAE